MCGICGQLNLSGREPVCPDLVRRMTGSLVHRGPDDEGFFFDGPVGFGFRRLAIIDLTGGKQPMSNEDGSIWVVFNGEIYNFPELRKELEDQGHTFRTRADTEVIVHGYETWGEDVVSHLNGMFAFAVWDRRSKRLVAARDRAGIKLVYYTVRDGQLFFASEIRALLRALGRVPEIDPVALNLFLRYRFTPSPWTIFKVIKKLAAGTRLIAEKGTVRIERWWNSSPEPFDPMPSVAEAAEELLERYRRAVRRQLLSDVPVGLLLSGGLDSSLLLALMLENGECWNTYTVGYGPSFPDDELAEAARTARIFGVPNYSVRISKEDFEETLPQVVEAVEEPIASSSIVPMFHVARRAARDLKVVLMGQGPDELFGGYKRHFGVRYGAIWRALPESLRGSAAWILKKLPRSEAVKRGIEALGVKDRARRYQAVFSLAPRERIDDLFRPDVLPPEAGDKVLEAWRDLIPLGRKLDELGGLQFLEVRSTLPDELLMYGDKLSMAHSLEVRVPFLDQEIIEFVERLDASFKVRWGRGKFLHRFVCRRFLPPEVVDRPKRGFAVNVVDRWFHSSVQGEFVDTLLDPHSYMYEYLDPQAVGKLLREHSAGREDHHKVLFSLVCFEVWLRNIFSRQAVIV